ncbi:SRPBCC family protein [Streptomyces antimicrobicus]|uniref:SRPBCC family protein n=1 Tax=Streptomyces antimicrobicus TaxID=2883108 RepID=A0ABS8BDI4_9ACTN|nr:SRPBCC family protein [Streptomyces antimicrobicus]MCB5182702.1 SRPBCC family protein [Streptomyces antimicrobicus]
MPVFRIVRRTLLPPEEAWRRLTDWERQGSAVPLTRTVIDTAPPTRVGTIFTARSGVGRLTVDDPMEVTLWRPPVPDRPALVRLEKRGRVVRGWAELEVRPLPGGGSEIHWRESLRVTGLPRLFDPAVASAGRAVFGRALDRLLR